MLRVNRKWEASADRRLEKDDEIISGAKSVKTCAKNCPVSHDTMILKELGIK